MNIEISAVICTHNRAAYLGRALCSLAAQTLSPARFEVLVVDNASSDETRCIFDLYADLNNWYYFYEAVPGLSAARNTGWENARGKYVVFMDDDAVASPQWLANYLLAFENAPAQTGCIGGRCLPAWEKPRPTWLSESMLTAFSIFHYGDSPLVLGPQQQLTGCNFAFPLIVLERVGGFREDLGRKGKSLLSNEDVEMREQLDRLGLKSIYHPEIIVEHTIPAERLTKEWFRQRAWWQGISQVRMAQFNGAHSTGSRMLSILQKSGWGILRMGLALVTINQAQRLRRELQVYEAAGEIGALWRLQASMSKPSVKPERKQGFL